MRVFSSRIALVIRLQRRGPMDDTKQNEEQQSNESKKPLADQ